MSPTGRAYLLPVVAALLALAAARASAEAQVQVEVELPRRSPRARISQQIGLTEITVDYESPAVRGRAIWGAAVPYGEVWRAGDTPAPQITFSRDVTFAGTAVAAGSYA